MDKPNLIIFKFKDLYQILKEIEEFLNFEVIEATSEKFFDETKINSKNSLIVTQKINESLKLQLVLDKLPINISKFLEKVSIQLIRSQFNQKSDLFIGKYKINLNSRELIKEKIKLKLTEKEVNIIVFLNNSKIPIGIEKLQSEVWGYNSKLETHTVETHIYRLRKKLLEKFNDNNFIQSEKNGYKIS